MREIIYISGALADKIGRSDLRKLANHIATEAKQEIDMLTYGESAFGHERVRYVGVVITPPEEDSVP